MPKYDRIVRSVVALLLAAVAGAPHVAAADALDRTDGSFLIRVERVSRDDLSKLLSGGIPVVMEMRNCLLVEGTADHLSRLEGLGYASAILDPDPSSSDYLIVGLRPDSSTAELDALGMVLHAEENWVLVRVVRNASLTSLATGKLFVSRVPHEPLQMPKRSERSVSSRAAESSPPDPLVQKIVDQVLPASIDQLWADLTSNPPTGTRLSTHPGCQDAAAYCHDLYVDLGLPAEYQQWDVSHAPNVIATQPGALRPDEVYIIEGHLDDLPSTPPAPGADDNASGSVTVLEAARVMSCYAFESTVKYLNVTGEESGLLGSTAYANDAWARGENVLGVINMDMNGWEGDGLPGPEDLDINYNSASEWLGLLFAECAQKYNTGLVVDAFFCPSLSVSDHYPFWQKGWSAICGITDNEGYCGHGGNYPYYHTSNDTIENCGAPAFFHSAVKASVATLAELARPFKVVTDQWSYACGSTIGVLVGDRDLDTDPGLAEAVVVEAWSDTEPTPESFTLDERALSSMLFDGLLPTSLDPPVEGDGLLSVTDGDTVSVRYIDSLDCDGATAVPYTATANIDCASPVISNVQASGVTGFGATITWDTDESSDSLVNFGTAPPLLSAAADGELVTAHDVPIKGLDECRGYLFSVSSTDEAGNSATDDGQGAFHAFTTGVNNAPELDSVDTPIAIPDNDPAGAVSTITVTEDETVLDVNVRVHLTHTYDGDLTLSLITPNTTSIALASRRGGSGNDFVDTVFDDEAGVPISDGSPPFTGSYQPDGSLSAADGIGALGNWQLHVVDSAGVDVGTIESWTLILTFPARECGPVAALDSHRLEVDACPSGGPGLGNGLWEAGEQIEFSLTLRNDGTDPLTGVSASVTPVGGGVTMLDDSAAVGDLAPGASGSSRMPHLIAELTGGLTCGQQIDFQVDIESNEGAWAAAFQQMVGEIIAQRSGVVLSEPFESGIPSTWTVVDGFDDGYSWYADDPTDPAGCGSPDPAPPIAGPWAAIDSSCTGANDRMDEELVSPLLDLTDAPIVTLEFDHWFEWLPQRQDEVADVDVRSTLTAGQWVNVARWTGASTANPEHVVIDLSAQAGNVADVEIRWHYHNARSDLTWTVDNVVVDFLAPEICLMESCAPSGASPPPIPDGAGASQPVRADRLTDDGSRISIAFDDACVATNTKILYGPLDQVGTYGISGAVCDISDPQTWDAVPAGDLWFVLVGDDGLGTEGSWGQGSEGERDGLHGSDTCGSSTKDITGSCP